MDKYVVKPLVGREDICVEVPGSKSITNRALMLAALGNCKCEIKGVLFSDDSRAFLSCLIELGFDVKISEEDRVVTVVGTSGDIPNKTATINVRSAGTAARFLTVMLSVCGGSYTLNSSEQMKKRPMAELLDALRDCGVTINCLEEEGHFPFEIHSQGLNKNEVTIDTTISSQYASALLMASVAYKMNDGLKIHMTGKRTNGAYIKITTKMMTQFGINFVRENDTCTVMSNEFGIADYQIEPDASAACYFYAMAPLLRTKVTVLNLNSDSMQGDMKFARVMERLGCYVYDTPEGLVVDGRKVEAFDGINVEMNDFSDQTMTMAVVAIFAKTPTVIENVGHIRMQESDRVAAIVTELNRMGIQASDYEEQGKTNIKIVPGQIQPAEIETYNDHRVAMAFTIVGLVSEGITIKDPMCCRKTFENYFEVIDSLYE